MTLAANMPWESSGWPLHRRMVKRAFDLVISSIALVFSSPLLLVIGGAIRLTSPGPALFRQERIGRGGRTFLILKFRTMLDGAPSQGPAITASGDPRVTWLGRWLRSTKLDELPQLMNVWMGDMSLVGPRPEVPRYVQSYSPEDRSILSVRPGITDLASITYRDEESVLAQFADRERGYVEVVLPRKLALGRDYIRRQSFTMDLVLLLRTFLAVLRLHRRPRADGATAPTSITQVPPTEVPAIEVPSVPPRHARAQP